MKNLLCCAGRIVNKKFDQYGRLMRLDRPIGSLLLLWPTLTALWFADFGLPLARHIVIFVCGVFVMRAAGCVLNDLADQAFDSQVERTKNRPLATGEVSRIEAYILAAVLLLLALRLVLWLNHLAIFLAVVGLALTLIYPFSKRRFKVPQLILGVVFNWGILMAYAAEERIINPSAALLFITAMVATLIYDTMYAMADRRDDELLGLNSSAIFLGKYDRLVLFVMYVVFFLLLSLIGHFFHMGMWYYLGLGLAGVFALYEYVLVWSREPAACYKAFLNFNWLWASVFFGVFLNYCPKIG